MTLYCNHGSPLAWPKAILMTNTVLSRLLRWRYIGQPILRHELLESHIALSYEFGDGVIVIVLGLN